MRQGIVWLGLLALTASSASAGGRAWWQAPRVEDSLYLDVSTRSDPSVLGLEIAAQHAYGDYLSVRVGLELLGSEESWYPFDFPSDAQFLPADSVSRHPS